MQEERRREPRFDCSGLISVIRDREGKTRSVTAGLIENISESGACIQMDQAVGTGDNVILKSRDTEVRAVVRHVRRMEVGFSIGVEFTGEFKWKPASNSQSDKLLPAAALITAPSRSTTPPSFVSGDTRHSPVRHEILPSRPLLVNEILNHIHRLRSMFEHSLGRVTEAADQQAALSAEQDTLPPLATDPLRLLDHAPGKAIILDVELEIKFANTNFLRTVGAAALLSSRSFKQFVAPDDLDRVIACAQATVDEIDGTKSLDFQLRSADGSLKDVSSWWRYSQTTEQISVNIVDWTIERRQERDLIALLSRSETEETVGIAGWTWDVRTETLHCSREFARIFGLDPKVVKLDQKGWLDIIHPEDRPRVQQAIASALSGTGNIDVEFRAIRFDGSVALMAVRADVLVNREGVPVSIVGRTLNRTGFKEW